MADKSINWRKAHRILEERGWPNASAGLREDWFWTGASIVKDGAPCETIAYVHSNWATTVISIETPDGDLVIECWGYSPEPDCEWPLKEGSSK